MILAPLESTGCMFTPACNTQVQYITQNHTLGLRGRRETQTLETLACFAWARFSSPHGGKPLPDAARAAEDPCDAAKVLSRTLGVPELGLSAILDDVVCRSVLCVGF